MKKVLITGATSGIGKACAYQFAKNGFTLVLTGRRTQRLEEIKQDIINQYKVPVLTLSFDVRNFFQVQEALENLPSAFSPINILINNAGLAKGLADIIDGSVEHWQTMIDTNIKGLLYVSKIVASQMRKAGGGHIINVGSTAAKEVYPWGNVYCATKYAVDALTKGMRMDFIKDNIKVSVVHPGFVETEFSIVRFDGDIEKAKKVYQGFEPLRAEDVAQVIYWMATVPANVNIAEVLLLPTAQASAMVVHRKE
ncbi:MAG: SDR family NAD(P)-dependent oxidoreductase [Bacteroidia bacterium]|nr:SDR family NAD(P)-dependent oxidoreductase [Bacteroidia bacterium]